MLGAHSLFPIDPVSVFCRRNRFRQWIVNGMQASVQIHFLRADEERKLMAMPGQRLAEAELSVPKVGALFAEYTPAARCGSRTWACGRIPVREGKLAAIGLVGDTVTMEQAAEAAQRAALNAIAALESKVGNLSQVAQISTVVVFATSARGGYDQQGKVGNGAGELLGLAFSAAGVHDRSAEDVAALPLGSPVEAGLVTEVTGP